MWFLIRLWQGRQCSLEVNTSGFSQMDQFQESRKIDAVVWLQWISVTKPEGNIFQMLMIYISQHHVHHALTSPTSRKHQPSPTDPSLSSTDASQVAKVSSATKRFVSPARRISLKLRKEGRHSNGISYSIPCQVGQNPFPWNSRGITETKKLSFWGQKKVAWGR